MPGFPLQNYPDGVNIEKKWDELGLSPQWLNESFQDAAFLVKTKLIYSILGFQNSTEQGKIENEIKVIQESGCKGLCIKKNGEWTPVALLQNELQWNKKRNAIVSKQNELQQWSYLSNIGLVPLHLSHDPHLVNAKGYPRDQDKMYPVARLSANELESVLTHARRFQGPESSAPIKGALQFVTYPKMVFRQPYLQNLNAQWKVHCSCRLITDSGDVYSFALGGNFCEHSFKNKWSRCLATTNGQPKMLDYMEFQNFDQRLVTTLPLTQDQTDEILKQMNQFRAKGIRFNVLKQNCVRFAAHWLQLASGVKLNTWISLLQT
ncbi:MAG: hypothetical protein LW832_08265, partial [Parachlamydia sp.]|nr:hypothetical protein [Parachlamydia sp.]